MTTLDDLKQYLRQHYMQSPSQPALSREQYAAFVEKNPNQIILRESVRAGGIVATFKNSHDEVVHLRFENYLLSIDGESFSQQRAENILSSALGEIARAFGLDSKNISYAKKGDLGVIFSAGEAKAFFKNLFKINQLSRTKTESYLAQNEHKVFLRMSTSVADMIAVSLCINSRIIHYNLDNFLQMLQYPINNSALEVLETLITELAKNYQALGSMITISEENYKQTNVLTIDSIKALVRQSKAIYHVNRDESGAWALQNPGKVLFRQSNSQPGEVVATVSVDETIKQLQLSRFFENISQSEISSEPENLVQALLAELQILRPELQLGEYTPVIDVSLGSNPNSLFRVSEKITSAGAKIDEKVTSSP